MRTPGITRRPHSNTPDREAASAAVLHTSAKGTYMGNMRPQGDYPERWSWAARAKCRGRETTLWFEADQCDERRETPKVYRDAKRLCDMCEVKEPCLEYALEMREPCGLWGGMTTPQRRKELRKRRREARIARVASQINGKDRRLPMSGGSPIGRSDRTRRTV